MENKQNVKDACIASLKTEIKKKTVQHNLALLTQKAVSFERPMQDMEMKTISTDPTWLHHRTSSVGWLNLPAFWKFTEHSRGGSAMPDTGFDLC